MFQERSLVTNETSTDMLFDAEGMTKWNTFSTPEETLAILAKHEASSFMNVLEICRILYDAKANWRGKAKHTTEKPLENGGDTNRWQSTTEDDWDRFSNLLTETGISPNEVNRLIKIHASWLNKGCVKKVFVDTAYLPSSKTALYEMATIDPMIKGDAKIMMALIDYIKAEGEIGVNEIREIKRNKGEERTKLTSPAKELDGKTALKMPAVREDVEKLNKKWKEVVVHLDTINELTSGIKGFGIAYINPADVIKQITERAIQKEIDWTIRKAHNYVGKFVINNANLIADLKKDETNAKGEKVSSAITFNKQLTEFLSMVTKHKLQKEIERIVKDRLHDVDRMKSKGLRANTDFKTTKKTKRAETITIKTSNVSPTSTANTSEDTSVSAWKHA